MKSLNTICNGNDLKYNTAILLMRPLADVAPLK